MRQAIAIFLILCTQALAQLQASDEATVCFVWNGGAGTSSIAGGCTQAAYDAQSQDASDFMSINNDGAPIVTGDDSAVTNSGGVLNVNHDGGTAIITGTVAYVDFSATYTDGYYECANVDTANVTLVGTTYDADTTCDIWIGGAFDAVQNASDAAIMNAAAYTRTCLVRGNATAAARIDIDTGGGTIGVSWKKLICVNSSWVNDGTRVVYDASGTDFAGTPIFRITDLSWVWMENFTAQDNDGNGGTPASGEDGFQHYSTTAAYYGITFINCSVTNCYRGFNLAGSTNDRLLYLYMFGCEASTVDSTVYLNGAYAVIDRCQLTSATTYNLRIAEFRGIVITGCLISGGGYGVVVASSGNGNVLSNNTFYNQTTACIGLGGSSTSDMSVVNNLFWVATVASDYVVEEMGTGAVLLAFEDYNFTNATNPIYRNGLAQGWEGSHSQAGLWSDVEANLWVDAAGGNFTPVDMIDDGMPTLNSGKSTPGAVWLTQIQTGGGGAGFPVTSTIGGHVQH